MLRFLRAMLYAERGIAATSRLSVRLTWRWGIVITQIGILWRK